MTNNILNKNNAFTISTFFVALITSIFISFMSQFFNGFSYLFGDRFDALIEAAILEHWKNVFMGLSPWHTVFYFYPYTGTLAYNDGYFIYGIIYTGFRLIGADPLISSELVSISLHAGGFFAAYYVMRRIVRQDSGWALVASVLFTIAGNALNQSGHAQLFSIAFVPVQILFIHQTLTAMAMQRRSATLIWGCGGAVFFSSWMMTAFYTAWFFAFFALLFCMISIITHGIKNISAFSRIIMNNYSLLLIIALSFLVSISPFLWLYLPKAAETGMHNYGDFLGHVSYIINVGQNNILYGHLISILSTIAPDDFPLLGEGVVGLPPMLLICFVTGSVYCWKRHAELRTLIATTILFWGLTLDVYGFSLWHLVYAIVPGAKAIRAVIRAYLFLTGPIIVIAVVAASDALARLGSRVAIAVFAAFLVAEQITTPPIQLNRREELARLASLPPPPADCRAFAATTAREGSAVAGNRILELYSHNVDAMLIAEILHLPTINGFSTFNPPDWNFDNPARPDYQARVTAYAQAHGIKHLCGLDLHNLSWAPSIAP